MIKILFVCLGNICRSPLAHAVFKDLVKKANLEDYFEIESCGTGRWHVGGLPDSRMRAEAKKHGVIMDHRARTWHGNDADYFDLILTMDNQNYHDVLQLSNSALHHKIKLFRSYDPDVNNANAEVPDPYYGGAQDFAHVYDIVERTSKNLLATLQQSIKK